MSLLTIDHLGKTYGSGDDAVVALADVHFDVAEGEFVTIVGPSGCGKTTLLRNIAGLLEPSHGEVRFRGDVVKAPPPEMSLVFQDYSRSLMPWLSVLDNVLLPLKYAKVNKGERVTRAEGALEQVGLADFHKQYPWQLSGGMQQRVAIARGLASQPSILLMDEPFGSVDAQTRENLEDLLLSIFRDAGLTVLLVTHDIDESVYLADRIVVLSHRPTEIANEHRVTLARPRDQITTKSSPDFLRLRAEVHNDIAASD